MNRSDQSALTQFAAARVARLATVRPDGSPHVVPVTFAVDSGDIVTAVDHKPKRSRRLQRLVNIEANPAVSLLADHWDEDWSRLWWVRVDGTATTAEDDVAAVDALVAKYPQYREALPDGPAIRIRVTSISSWQVPDGRGQAAKAEQGPQ
jgi:PPOX class probable F420-dependent enzyme